jgi:hypothetical protein
MRFIIIFAACLVAIIAFGIIGNAIINDSHYEAINEPYFTEQDNIPDGVYRQGMWGNLQKENDTWTWWFPICEHGGWGPLHSKWNVSESALESLNLEPINEYGSYQLDRKAYSDGLRLFIQIKNKVIVNAWVEGSKL